jgi:hypothetical protein
MDVGIEIAIWAFAGAEGPVHIDPEQIVGVISQSGPRKTG